MRTVLTIAGSDPSGGAGIQADLKTFAAFGVYGASAITAITVQNTLGIDRIVALEADVVTAEIEALAGDLTLHATKTGMLANAAIVEAVAAAIDELELPLVVVDPVLVATSGQPLLDADGTRALAAELLARARVVTPNIAEAETLSGRRIGSLEDARDAARRIRDLGPRAVLITGGHAHDRFASDRDVVDLLLDGEEVSEFRVARVEAGATHGTGCTFASAVAAGLALGRPLPDAAARAQRYVAGALAHRLPVGRGRAPLDHFWETPRILES
jgi:hydroxymethylpyrimidine/phosphomethylpyrimidine kinase